MSNPPLKPNSVNTVSGSVAITGENAIKAEKYLSGLLASLDFMSKIPWGRGFESHQRPVLPFCFGPFLCSVKLSSVAALDQCASQSLKIVFCSPRAGIPASNKSNIHHEIIRTLIIRWVCFSRIL
jgi:hypothetical protein